MTPINVFSTIDLHNDSTSVEVAMVVGFADFSTGKLSVKPVGGTMSELNNPIKPEQHYTLGSAADLITKHIRMICTGRIGAPTTTGARSFYVTCLFFQEGQHIASSNPVSGKFGDGQAIQDFNIICSFS
jgi:hypothetical protein